MREVLKQNMDKIESSNVLERLNLKKDNYILVSAHREENIDNEKNFMSLMTAINNIAEKYRREVLFSAVWNYLWCAQYSDPDHLRLSQLGLVHLCSEQY